MKIKASHLCRCGHQAWSHTYGLFNDVDELAEIDDVLAHPSENRCGFCYRSNGTCKKFQLPNLDLIEYLAEKRGLV